MHISQSFDITLTQLKGRQLTLGRGILESLDCKILLSSSNSAWSSGVCETLLMLLDCEDSSSLVPAMEEKS